MRILKFFLLAAQLLFVQQVPAQSSDEQIAMAKEIYIYGYPLVLMDITKNSFTEGSQSSNLNQFVNLREFPNANFHDVVSPNADTLYSIAWLDLAEEPLILSVPKIENRFYLLPVLDEWTNVIASIGTRTNQGASGNYALVGPYWKGTLPSDVQEIRSPTNYVWIIGRTETKGAEDYAAVHRIQDEYKLMPLSKWGKAQQVSPINYRPSKGIAPVDQVASLDGTTFFTRLSALLSKDAPPQLPQDKEIVSKMANIGLIPGKPFDQKLVSSAQLNTAAQQGLEQIKAGWKDELFARNENGWLILGDSVGKYASNYLLRAIIAYGGLGANLEVDAIYPVTRVDSEGKPLDGKYRYVVHFDRAPPVKAFWSITMYNDQQFFVANPINRYKIGSLNNLNVNADGSFDIYIQKDAPDSQKQANWLPAPEGGFNLMMRLYYPEKAILDGAWKPPAVVRLPNH